jgi:CDP-glucose 4,6-dehydratase
VLEPVSGYLLLAERLYKDGAGFDEAWNFGPSDEDARTVGWIVGRVASRDPAIRWEPDTQPQPHEAHYLKLDSGKARTRLNWQPRWNLETALDKTMAWHDARRSGQDMHAVTLAQIADYAGDNRRASSVAV